MDKLGTLALLMVTVLEGKLNLNPLVMVTVLEGKLNLNPHPTNVLVVTCRNYSDSLGILDAIKTKLFVKKRNKYKRGDTMVTFVVNRHGDLNSNPVRD